jgi:hypothetical protein
MTKPTKETALESRAQAGEKLYSPSTARNREPIRDVFLNTMPAKGKILEVGAGTGEHAVCLAQALPSVTWMTGDPDAPARVSIAAWIADAKLPNLIGPHAIDVTAEEWGIETQAPFDGILSINMIHIAPFAAAQGLFAGAGRLLALVHTALSNEAFDGSLKARDPRWGVRDLDREIAPLAQNNALALEQVVEMPANNLSVIFRKN